MATEYKLNYTASEINNKLGMIDKLSEDVGDIDVALDVILSIQNSYIGGEGA